MATIETPESGGETRGRAGQSHDGHETIDSDGRMVEDDGRMMEDDYNDD